MMNPKSAVKVKHAEQKIEMNTTFAKMIENPLSDEYALLQKLKMENPEFKVSRRKIKSNPNKDSYKGLTYEYMEMYIEKHDDKDKTIMAEYKMLRGLTDEAEEVLAESFTYLEMKEWFLAKFPAIKSFHEARAKLLEVKPKSEADEAPAAAEAVAEPAELKKAS